MITGIVVALPEEISTLTAQKMTRGGCAFINDSVLVALAGTGPHNAQAAALLLIAQGATQLISWGCAAALNESLRSGDLTLATSLINAEEPQTEALEITRAWQSHCQKQLGATSAIHTGPLASSKAIITTSEHKKRLHTTTGANALDMESMAVAKVAKQHGYPFIAIRAIADPVNMNLPCAISAAINTDGEVVLSRLLRYLARHPTELFGLITVGLQFNAARKTLKMVAKQLNVLIRFN